MADRSRPRSEAKGAADLREVTPRPMPKSVTKITLRFECDADHTLAGRRLTGIGFVPIPCFLSCARPFILMLIFYEPAFGSLVSRAVARRSSCTSSGQRIAISASHPANKPDGNPVRPFGQGSHLTRFEPNGRSEHARQTGIWLPRPMPTCWIRGRVQK